MKRLGSERPGAGEIQKPHPETHRGCGTLGAMQLGTSRMLGAYLG